MSLFFRICLLLMPWVIIPIPNVADQFRLPKSTFFDLIMMGLICFGLFNGVRIAYRNKYLSLMTIWIFITIFFSWYVPYTNTYDLRQKVAWFTIEPTLHFILSLFSTFIVLSTFIKEDFYKIARTLCYSVTLVSVMGILQVIGLDPFGKLFQYTDLNNHTKFTAFLDHPSMAGNYVALIIPLFFIFIKENKFKLMLLVSLVGLFLSQSMISFVALAVGLIVYIFLRLRHIQKARYIIIISVFLILLGILLSINKDTLTWQLSGRQYVWAKSWTIFEKNPFFGQGLGVYKLYNVRFGEKFATTAHNDWLERGIDVGILGLFLFFLLIRNCFKKFNYEKDNIVGFSYFTMFVMFLVIMFGSFPMEFAACGMLGLVSFWAMEKL